MKIHVSDLEGVALDWAVITATKAWETAHKHFPTMTLDPSFIGVSSNAVGGYVRLLPRNPMRQGPQPFSPSTEWEHCGPLIENHITALNKSEYGGWWSHSGNHLGEALSPLECICRAIVAAKLGDEIEIPDELVK